MPTSMVMDVVVCTTAAATVCMLLVCGCVLWVCGACHGFVTVQMHAGGHVLQVVMGVVVHLYVGIMQGSVY